MKDVEHTALFPHAYPYYPSDLSNACNHQKDILVALIDVNKVRNRVEPSSVADTHISTLFGWSLG